MLNLKGITIAEQLSNLILLAFVLFILYLATYYQFVYHELPCPLCLLQRVGFIGIAISLSLNLKFGFKPSHYGFALLSALFTSFVALRQIALHILPGSGFYGSALFGLHFYTWSFIFSMILAFGIVIMLSIDRQYEANHIILISKIVTLFKFLFFLLFLIIIINLIATFLECGLSFCTDNPIAYLII